MVRAAQLAAVVIALVFVLSAGGYGIVRGVTAKDYSAFNACVRDYNKQMEARGGPTSNLPRQSYVIATSPEADAAA